MGELVRVDAGELVPASEPLPSDRNPAAVYLASLGSERARRAMLGRLRYIAGVLGASDPLAVPWHQLRYQHVAAIRAKLIESGQAPATINLALSALRGVARHAFRLGLLSAEDFERVRQVESVKGSRLPTGRALSRGELAALLDACANDDTAAGRRDAAAIALLYAGGLRRAELVGLDLADHDAATGALVVRGGKGNKDRQLWVTNGAADALGEWLAVRGSEPGPLFLPVDKAGRLTMHRMTSQVVRNLLNKRAAEAGVRELSPHDLRRTFISELLDAGADIATVAGLAGHANVQTTARYDRRGDAAKQRAIGLLCVPFRSRQLGGRGG